MHRADFELTEGNGTIVGLKTGGHEDGAVWGFWAATGQRVKSDVWSDWEGMEQCQAGDTIGLVLDLVRTFADEIDSLTSEHFCKDGGLCRLVTCPCCARSTDSRHRCANRSNLNPWIQVADTLSVYRNERRLGTVWTGLAGRELCWFASVNMGSAVRVKVRHSFNSISIQFNSI